MVVIPHLNYSLILGTNWLGFKASVKHQILDGFCHNDTWGGGSSATLAGEAVPGPSMSALHQRDMEGWEGMEGGEGSTPPLPARICLWDSCWSSCAMKP